MIAWHGCSKEAVTGICSYGAADLRKLDGGFFGAGIYLTPHAEYACQYSYNGRLPDEDGLFPVLLCMVVVCNTYPITRKADYAFPDILCRESVSIFHYYHPIPYNPEKDEFELEGVTRADKGLKAGRGG